MKKIKYLMIAFAAFMLFPIINGMGCDFNFNVISPDHKQFGSCKFGQYTLIDYPNPKQDNGYIVLKGLYFYAFGNAAILVTSNEDHTKKITSASIESLNFVNNRFWYQMAMERLNHNEMVAYVKNPQPKLYVIPYDGTLAITDSRH